MSIANSKFVLFSFALMLLSSTASADTFRANVQTTTLKGHSILIQYELKYTVSADNIVSGKLKNFTQKNPCLQSEGNDITGKIEGDSLSFTVKMSLQGCEENNFVGKKQADGWAGKMRITGAEREILFTKQ
ncbi:hypothetical protein KZZ10_00760 [Alcaligenaceae bacterium LF4-65]|uniref:Uncharacterized protein n=1 Tax=Zwartia hollandica TaxID=324606 RepID=A0A953N7T5_9BURK|nr:hypothetical protein [Zwartia hollandica]MBZ1349163.1 hypothetical protein [Zwartia hollandica]